MNIWEKLSRDPAYCSFHDDTLEMMDITRDYIHIRVSISTYTYQLFEDDFREFYKDPENKDLYIDIGFLNPVVLPESILPQKMNFGDYYSILSLEKDKTGIYSLCFERGGNDFYMLKFTFERCVSKPLGEFESGYYNAHPEMFNVKLDLSAFS